MAAFEPVGWVPSLAPLDPRGKPAVVSIDFGTAYTGIAYAHRSQPRTIKYAAPGAYPMGMQTKVPTALLKLPDDRWVFGNAAKQQYHNMLGTTEEDEECTAQLFKRFKMELRDKRVTLRRCRPILSRASLTN